MFGCCVGPTKGGPHGPYIQSQRLPIYKEYAEKLVKVRFITVLLHSYSLYKDYH